MRPIRLFVEMSAAVLLCSGTLCRAADDNTKVLRNKLISNTHAMFATEKWDDLESTAKDLRTTKAKFPEGMWKLSYFYKGLDPSDFAKTDAQWDQWFQRLDRWKAAHPDSITQCVAQAMSYCTYAWNARGGGWASTVSDQGWKLMADRMAKARQTLEEGEKLPDKCPEWYVAMHMVALAQGWSRADYDALYKKAVTYEPTYYQYYTNKGLYLLPRWFGRDGEWEQFAEEASKNDDPAEGMVVYTRVAWSLSEYFDNLFKESRIEWPKMKQGFLDMEKSYPDSSWNLNHFLKFAVMAGDRETAAALVKRIGDKPDVNSWNSADEFQRAKLWATGGFDKTKPAAALGDGGHGRVFSVRFSPSGKLAAAGYEDGSVIAWDVAKGAQVWNLNLFDSPTMTVAFSPDGKLFAAGNGSFDYPGEKGTVKVCDAAMQKPLATITSTNGSVFAIEFTPDGRKLAISGGPYNKRGEARIWDVASGSTQSLDWAPQHTHALIAGAISPDSRVLVTDCNRSITVWDMVDSKSLYDTRQELVSYVHCLAFSPDGKTLAAAVGDMPNQPGGIALWDAPSYKKRLPGIETATGGLFAVAFSPDSKLLAGAGFDGCVYVWEAATGQELGALYDNEGQLLTLAFSPDGKTIASGGRDGKVRLWKVPAQWTGGM